MRLLVLALCCRQASSGDYIPAIAFSAAEPDAPHERHCWPDGGNTQLGTRRPPHLLLATHTALLEVEVGTGCVSLLSRGHGHYQSVVSAAGLGLADGSLLVGSQARLAQADRNATFSSLLVGSDALLMFDFHTRRTRGAWRLPTSSLQDTVLNGAGGEVFSADSDFSAVTQIRIEECVSSDEGALPAAHRAATRSGRAIRLRLVRRFRSSGRGTPPELARAAHANSVLLSGGHVWVLNSNRVNASRLVLLDVLTGKQRDTIALGGPNCHNPLFHRGRVLYLNSSVGGLAVLHPDGTSAQLWAAGPSYLTKGLAVIDDVAYFGISPRVHSDNADPAYSAVTTELAAFELTMHRQQLLWRRKLPYPGMLNSVSSPLMQEDACSWHACDSSPGAGISAGTAAAIHRAKHASHHHRDHMPRRTEWAGVAPKAFGDVADAS